MGNAQHSEDPVRQRPVKSIQVIEADADLTVELVPGAKVTIKAIAAPVQACVPPTCGAETVSDL